MSTSSRCRDLRGAVSARSRSASARAASVRSSPSTTGMRSRVSRDARVDRRPGRARSGATPTSCRPVIRRWSRSSPGFTPLVAAPRLARALGIGELYLKLDIANPTHSFKDRVVAVAAAKALELGLDTLACYLDRQPRERRRGARGRDRHARGHLLPGRARAREARRHHGLRRARSTPCAAATTTAAARQRARRRGRLGIRQHQPARLLRGGLEDARVRDRRAARLGDSRRRGRRRSAPARCSRRSGRASSSSSASGCRRRGPRIIGGQAAGCSPVATAFAEDRRSSPVRPQRLPHSLAIGNPADGDLADRDRDGLGRCGLRGPRGRDRANIPLLAETARRLRRGRDRRGARRAARSGAPRRRRRARPRRPARHGHRPEDAAARRRQLRSRSRSTPTSTRCSRSWGSPYERDRRPAASPSCATRSRRSTSSSSRRSTSGSRRSRALGAQGEHGSRFVDPEREEWLAAAPAACEHGGPLSTSGVDRAASPSCSS